jgi:predicted RNA-binding Zn-ribbon protein involved in translation (DUF1610 family)
MPMACHHNIPETLKGAGPCDISFEVKKRNGMPNWWCRTHGMDASAPDGAALPACPGSWFEPVPQELQITLDLADGEVGIWGAIAPAIETGGIEPLPGGVHVHRRSRGSADKDLDASFNIVRIIHDGRELVVESMAALAFSVSELAGQQVVALLCPRCGGQHIDEQRFATQPHSKHVCNSCGRNFWSTNRPSISNPLAAAYSVLGIDQPPQPVGVDRELALDRTKYSAIALWPSNSAILSTMTRPEETGIHVHAWDLTGRQVIDETHSPVTLDGERIDEELLRALAVQRSLAHNTPIRAMPCSACGSDLLSPATGWIEPTTEHHCAGCGAVTKTRRRVFLNPLADK